MGFKDLTCLLSLQVELDNRRTRQHGALGHLKREVEDSPEDPSQEQKTKQVELSLCSHFPLDSSHVELQVI